MSLAINTTTPEGMVLATDSRQSYRNRKGMARIGSDNASKLFQLNKRIGVAVTGLAFLSEDGVMKNISKFIEQFKRETEVEKLNVKEAAEKLHYLFNKKYNWQEKLDKLPDQIRNSFIKQGIEVMEVKKEQHRVRFRIKDKKGNIKEGFGDIDKLVLFIAGYNKDGSHEVYNIYIPGEVIEMRNSEERGKEYGANWIGQTDVVSRIIKGWDAKMLNILFVGEAIKQKGQQEIEKQLNGLEYVINWGTMPLQDAIDFSVLAIQTTSAIQRFSDGIQVDPGSMPGVGGGIDVAVITPNRGFAWINKKKLKVGEKEIDLDR